MRGIVGYAWCATNNVLSDMSGTICLSDSGKIALIHKGVIKNTAAMMWISPEILPGRSPLIFFFALRLLEFFEGFAVFIDFPVEMFADV